MHWKGGVHTELQVPRRRRGQNRDNTPKDVVEAVRALSRVCPDSRIAAWLTQNGLRTAKGHGWTRQHVTGLRHWHKIPAHDRQQQEAHGWMNLTQAATYLGIDRVTLRVAAQREEIPAIRPLAIGPWVLKRDDLDAPAAQSIVQRVQRQRETGRREAAGQLTLDIFKR